jgi:hypothetical protein
MDSKNKTSRFKIIFKNIGFYLFATLCCTTSGYIGYWYSQSKNKKESELKVATKIKASQINLAVDQNNNLIVIDKKTGDYVIYEDTVGTFIYSLYAKNLWTNQ